MKSLEFALGAIRDLARPHVADTVLMAVFELAVIALHPDGNIEAHVKRLRREMPSLFMGARS